MVRITTPSRIPEGIIGEEYSLQLEAESDYPVIWEEWSASPLPEWLSISSTGLLTGVPPEGIFYHSFYVQAYSDEEPTRARTSFDLFVSNPVLPMEILTESLPSGKKYSQYNADIEATGSGNIFWEIEGALPGGVQFSGSWTNAYLNGYPWDEGTFPITVKVTNEKGTDTKEYILVIEPEYIYPYILSYPQDGNINEPYFMQMESNKAGVTWSLSEPSFGLSIDPETGIITGMPTAAGWLNIVVTVDDGVHPYSGSDGLTIHSPEDYLRITTPYLPEFFVDTEVSRTQLYTNREENATWIGHVLPEGVTLSSDGILSGKPTKPEWVYAYIQVTVGDESYLKRFQIEVQDKPNTMRSEEELLAIRNNRRGRK